MLIGYSQLRFKKPFARTVWSCTALARSFLSGVMARIAKSKKPAKAGFFMGADSDAIGALGHHLGQQAHAELHRRREAITAGFKRAGRVLGFVGEHLFENRPG